jgi:hypothetical protein
MQLTRRFASSVDEVVLIRLIVLAILLALLWPLPPMLTYANPEEGAILGRFTARYFALMVAYLGLVLAWTGAAGWIVARLDTGRLTRLRTWIGAHIGIAAGIALAVITGISAVRVIYLADRIGFPPSFLSVMQVLPTVLVVGFIALLAVVLDVPLEQRIESALTDWRNRMHLARLQPTSIAAALTGLIAVFLINIITPRYWEAPLGIDGSMHVYVGRHLLNGGVPYQTLIVPYVPLRYAISVLWSLGAMLFNVPVVHAARAFDAAASVGVLLLVYATGKRLTGRAAGGFAAAAVLMGTEMLQEVLIPGPIFHPVTILLMLGGLALAQRGRWFWAGVLLALSTLSYGPVSVVTAAVVIAALIQRDTPRWRAVIKLIGGGLVVLLITVAVLLAIGVSVEAYQQVVVAVLRPLSTVLTPGDRGEASTGLYSNFLSGTWLARYPVLVRWNFRGDWEMAALLVLGIAAAFSSRGARQALTTRNSAVLLIPGLLLLPTILIDEGGTPDWLLRMSILAPLVAEVFAVLFGWHSEKQHAPLLRTAAAWGLALWVLVIGHADATAQQQFVYTGVTAPLSKQQRMADRLHDVLQPGDTVFSVSYMWYQALTGADNALPIRWFGGKSDILEASGWSAERALDALDVNKPVVVMWFGPMPESFPEWLAANYTNMGLYDPNHLGYAQQIYVLNGHEDVMAVMKNWPLQK